MYQIKSLGRTEASSYKKMTFPRFQYVLENLEEKSVIAFGAVDEEQPIGLILAEIKPQKSCGEILSLFVEPAYRSRGVGTALVNALQTRLKEENYERLKMSYVLEKPTTPALERIISKCHWTDPEPHVLMCKTEITKAMQIPWLVEYNHLRGPYDIFPWQEISARERENILEQQRTNPWIPEDLIPFDYEEDLYPSTSLGLRYRGELVGWFITHRIAIDTIRYTCSFIRLDLQKNGRSLGLFAEAVKRQYEANIPYLIWTTALEHKSMANFIRNRFKPYITSLRESRITYKYLGESAHV